MKEPKFTKTECAEAVRALKRAKRLLARNYDDAHHQKRVVFICHALRGLEVYGRGDELVNKLQLMIEARLDETHTLEGWLVKNYLASRHPQSVFHHEDLGMTNEQWRDKLQETRHRWVDALIQEFRRRSKA